MEHRKRSDATEADSQTDGTFVQVLTGKFKSTVHDKATSNAALPAASTAQTRTTGEKPEGKGPTASSLAPLAFRGAVITGLPLMLYSTKAQPEPTSVQVTHSVAFAAFSVALAGGAHVSSTTGRCASTAGKLETAAFCSVTASEVCPKAS